MSTDKNQTSTPIFDTTAKDLLSEWAEGGTLGRLERAKAQVESLAKVAGYAIGNSAHRVRDVLLLTIEDAIAQVEQDDAFFAAMSIASKRSSLPGNTITLRPGEVIAPVDAAPLR